MAKYVFFILVIIFVSCKKEKDPPAGDPVPVNITLTDAKIISMDSSCIIVPNIFTPNGDGINDLFYPGQKNIDSMHVIIRNSNNTIVFSQSGIFWDGNYNGSITSGMYNYEIFFRSTSFADTTFFGSIYCCKNPGETCFTNTHLIRTSDMMDPNLCGFFYVSGNELFCVN